MGNIANFQIANPDGARELIMFVDDDTLVTLLVQRLLTDEGYRVILANNGVDALEAYKRFQSEVKLVIVDFKMPGMDGFALFNELRAINPQAYVVLTSGILEPANLQQMVDAGLRGFIPKPFSQAKLLAAVDSALRHIQDADPQPRVAPAAA